MSLWAQGTLALTISGLSLASLASFGLAYGIFGVTFHDNLAVGMTLAAMSIVAGWAGLTMRDLSYAHDHQENR